MTHIPALPCGCNRHGPCERLHSRVDWETWLEGIAEAAAEDRRW